jgi:hypothetical protein
MDTFVQYTKENATTGQSMLHKKEANEIIIPAWISVLILVILVAALSFGIWAGCFYLCRGINACTEKAKAKFGSTPKPPKETPVKV